MRQRRKSKAAEYRRKYENRPALEWYMRACDDNVRNESMDYTDRKIKRMTILVVIMNIAIVFTTVMLCKFL